MSNIDEQKLKDLLHGIAEDIAMLLESNMYRSTVVSDMHKRIDRTNLLTDSEKSDTV